MMQTISHKSDCDIAIACSTTGDEHVQCKCSACGGEQDALVTDQCIACGLDCNCGLAPFIRVFTSLRMDFPIAAALERNTAGDSMCSIHSVKCPTLWTDNPPLRIDFTDLTSFVAFVFPHADKIRLCDKCKLAEY